jgi:hypothetical protein
MTATTVMNEKEILLKNLEILHIEEHSENREIKYTFADKTKHPK